MEPLENCCENCFKLQFSNSKEKAHKGDLLNGHMEISRDQEVGHDFQGTMQGFFIKETD